MLSTFPCPVCFQHAKLQVLEVGSLTKSVDHVVAVQRPLWTNRSTLASKLIDQVQHPYRPPVMSEGADEVISPDVIGSLRTKPDTRSIVQPQASARLR